MEMMAGTGDIFCFLHTARAMGAIIKTVATLSTKADTTPESTAIATMAILTFPNLDSMTSAMRMGIFDSMNRVTIPMVPAIIMRILKSMAPTTVPRPNSISSQKKVSHTEKITAEQRAI